MTSFSFLRQMLQDVRHQKVRTALTLLGITWGTVSVSLLVAFGEGLQKRIVKNQRGLGENIVIAWPSRTSIPYQGLGKGRRIRVTEDDIDFLGRPTFSPAIALATSLVLGTIGTLAGYFPAKRAASVNPAVSLRYE